MTRKLSVRDSYTIGSFRVTLYYDNHFMSWKVITMDHDKVRLVMNFREEYDARGYMVMLRSDLIDETAKRILAIQTAKKAFGL